ncbi:MAG TPA: peptide chain release factor N(5)-glutamine methyltransferase [Cellvibrionaceae bacterium]
MSCTITEALYNGRAVPSDTARLDVELLLCHCLDKPRSYLRAWPERLLTEQQHQQFKQLLARRLNGEPIAYILGEREFWSLPLKVSPATLIPRPETELLVETALEIRTEYTLDIQPNCRVLDLGTGTGAIALALARERPHWQITATDISAAALTLARHNSDQLNLAIELLESNWFSAVTGQFQLILSNPPYICATDPHLQEGDVRFEPASALVAEHSGLQDLLLIIDQAPNFLIPGGWLLLEHGWQQADAVVAALTARGFKHAHCRADLNQQPRMSLAQWQVQTND